MGCNCMTLAQLTSATDFIRCVRAAVSASPGTTWDGEAHVAFYRFLATQVDILSERRQDAETIRAVAWGSEPAKTAEYIARFGDWRLPSDPFWTCLETPRIEAEWSRSEGSGPYWAMISAAATSVGLTESGGVSKDESMPMWMWGLFAAAVGVALWAVLKD